jgi:hypothetical protein
MKRKTVHTIIWLLILIATFGVTCYSEETVIFGPQQFTRGKGNPVIETKTFSSSFTGSGFLVKIHNGDDQGSNRISSADVILNGNSVAKPSDFNQQVEWIERQVSLESNNELSVKLEGKPGSFITITIYKVDPGEELTVSIWASSDTIQPGESTTLHWTSTGGLSASIDQGIGPVALSGSVEVTPQKETTYTITVNGPNGKTVTDSVIIKIGGLSIRFTSPSDGDTFSQPYINLAGVVTNSSGGEIGVTVNGTPAILDGNNFFLNLFPLAEGENLLEAVVTDSQGNTASASIMVVKESSGYYFLLKTIAESGVSPLEVPINIECNFNFQLPVLEFSGPGSVEIIDASKEGYVVRITGPGVYNFSASVVDPEGNTLLGRLTIRVLDRTEMENMLKTKWDSMVVALKKGDIETAVSYFAVDRRDKYRILFGILLDKLPHVVNNLGSIQPVSFKPYMAECLIDKTEIIKGQSMVVSYSVYFAVDKDGIWRISWF